MTIEKAGRRYYITGDTYSLREPLKSAGCHWDAERRAWWTSKLDVAEQFAATDSPAKAPSAEARAEDPDQIRLVGKGRYKGRIYYIRWMGATRKGTRAARLVTLDAKLDFWADLDQVEIVKEYRPREERGQYGRPTGRMEYTTLGGIRDYIARMKHDDPQGVGRGVPNGYYMRGGQILSSGCAECSRRGEMCPTCQHDFE